MWQSKHKNTQRAKKMEITAADISRLINGTVEGDATVVIKRPNKIEHGEVGDICFLGNDDYESYAYTSQASALIVDKKFTPKNKITPTLVRVENVYSAVAVLMSHFQDQNGIDKVIIAKSAVINNDAKISNNVSIGEFVCIESGANIAEGVVLHPHVLIGKNVHIGANSVLHSGVKIYADTTIGDNCIIHSNAVIGSDGFGYAPNESGAYKKIPHLGNVILENDVEVGANTTIDRAVMGSTRISEGVKLDNLIQIAHNVEIGGHTVIAAQTGIAGSTKIGKYCRIGGQVGIAGHLKIGDYVQVQAQSGIGGDIKDHTRVYGSPAIDYSTYVRSYAIFKKLPSVWRRIEKLIEP